MASELMIVNKEGNWAVDVEITDGNQKGTESRRRKAP